MFLQGNHGEDVKELYYYQDSTPTHSYMRATYKYPQSEFPYDDLIKQNNKLGKEDMEYEIQDTGVSSALWSIVATEIFAISVQTWS